MIWSRMAALAATAVLAAALGQGASTAHAADADASAVSAVPDGSGAFLAGSAQPPNEQRSGVAGRWDAARNGFAWLERVDAAPGAADGLTAVVPMGAFVSGIGYANGALAVAKMDADTGTLRRACGPTGVRLNSLGPSVLPGRAVAAGGGTIVVVGGTLAQPTRGFIAEVDGSNCSVRRSALLGAEDSSLNVGFTSVDLDRSGNPVVSGFSGTKPAIFRFDAELLPRGSQTFDAGGSSGAAFLDVRVGPGRGVAVGSDGSRLRAQCFTLPALSADERCGAGGLPSLSFHADGMPAGATLGRLPSGSLLVAGSHAGKAGSSTSRLRPALGAFEPEALAADAAVFAGAGTKVFDPFPAVASGFGAVTASSTRIWGAGSSGSLGSRRPFLFSSGLDGAKPTFTPLTLDTAPPAPVEPAPPAPPRPPDQLTGGPPVASGATPSLSLASARFARLARRPAADGTFGFLTLSCRRDCTARGRYTAPLGGTRIARLGGTKAKLAAGWRLRVRLALARRGLRTLSRARRLQVNVRFVVTDTAGARQLVRRTLTLRARRGS